jgi:hypothetical protein
MILALAVVLALTGCALTLHDMRERPPDRTAVVPGDQAVIVGCFVEGLETSRRTQGLTIQTNRRPELQRSTVAMIAPDIVSPWPMLDLTFTQIAGGVFVESRLGDFYGGEGGMMLTRQLQDAVWPILQRCVRRAD